MRRRLTALLLAAVAALTFTAVSAAPASAHGKCEIVDGVKLCW
jgi:hypothetical protein